MQDQRQAKLGGFIANLAAMDELINFAAIAAQVDSACPQADRSKGGRPPYPTEVMVRLRFIQALYNLSDEDCEYQVLDRMSFQRFCRWDGALHIPDARMLWSFKEREALNQGKAPEGCDAKRLAHTDRDARWTKQHGKSFYGYKLHANADARYKLIRRVKVTAANIEDGQTLKDVLDTSNTRGRLLADRDYDAQANRDLLQAGQIKGGIARRAKP